MLQILSLLPAKSKILSHPARQVTHNTRVYSCPLGLRPMGRPKARYFGPVQDLAQHEIKRARASPARGVGPCLGRLLGTWAGPA